MQAGRPERGMMVQGATIQRIARAIDKAKAERAANCADVRYAKLCALLERSRQLRDDLKEQADSISRTERRFGSPEIQHLARLLDDAWMALDSLASDVEPACNQGEQP